ncbi:MAG: hypothetical protein IJZ23_02505 [Roseburia sp.]|nr:hypothetical protein [Roseburia sp.]
MNLEGETILEWMPIEDVSKRYDVSNITWQGDKIEFMVVEEAFDKSNQPLIYRFIWNSSELVSYHVADETYRADCWGITKEFKEVGRFFARKSSMYLDKMKERSPLFPNDAIHFTIIGTNIIVDVIATDYPIVKR